ncbi:MAG: hypothetical protein NW217_03445 [Hyphomicrobiaceae bacterium]|nr:hypothetical protein [Hyphomicrobiaceae bacterium]
MERRLRLAMTYSGPAPNIPRLAVLVLSGTLAGCAQALPTLPWTQQSPLEATGPYQLSSEERDLDCRKLTGRMQLRILQIRDFETQRQTTDLSKTAQGLAINVGGGTRYGIDPDGRYRRDIEILEVYNRRLAELKCRTYDLQKELATTDVKVTPKPVAPATPAKANGKPAAKPGA